jgi:MFS superfamily sulfate permease-like transporter
VTGLVAAASLGVILLFLTGPLRYVPVAALGAVLMLASLSLADLGTLRMLWKIDRVELFISLFVTLGVVAFGAIDAILVAVAAAVIRYVRFVSRPKTEVLGKVPGLPGFHGVDRHPDAETTPGLVLFRFNGPVVFFNAPHFKRSLLDAVDSAGPGVRWVVVDMIPIPLVDATGHFVVQEVVRALKTRGTTLVVAGRMTEFREWGRKRGYTKADDHSALFPDLESATAAFGAGKEPERNA